MFEELKDRFSMDKVDQLKVMFMTKNPWWACVVADVPIKVRTHTRGGQNLAQLTSVAATDGKAVYLMPDFFRSAKTHVIASIVNHEYQHIVRMHSYRMGHREPELWNIACDHVINLDILAGGGKLPDGGFSDPKYKGWEEERIYEDLLDRRNQEQQKQKQQQDSNPKPQPGAPGDSEGGEGESQPSIGEPEGGEPQDGEPMPSDHGVVVAPSKDDGTVLTEDEVVKEVEDMKSKIRMAQAMEKAAGKGGSPGSRMLQDLVEPKKNWRDEVRQFISRKGKPIGRSWGRLDRRSASIGVWVPAEIKEGMDWVVVGMDVSGSTSQRESDAFIANFTKIRNSISINRMTIVPFDTHVIVDNVVELKKGGKYKHKFVWGGGTDVQDLFDWIEKGKTKPDCVIIFTDMDFNYGFNNHGIQPLWASSVPVRNLRSKPGCGRVVEIGV